MQQQTRDDIETCFICFSQILRSFFTIKSSYGYPSTIRSPSSKINSMCIYEPLGLSNMKSYCYIYLFSYLRIICLLCFIEICELQNQSQSNFESNPHVEKAYSNEYLILTKNEEIATQNKGVIIKVLLEHLQDYSLLQNACRVTTVHVTYTQTV